jgi:multidrug efflux pump subunit AcrB
MNGSEVEIKRPPIPKFSYNQESEITDAEKMDMMVFATTPIFKTFCKMFENIIIRSRNRAMEADPTNERAQAAALTVAHAQKAMYEEFRGDLEFKMMEHVADVRLRVQQEDLNDHKKLEAIIFANQTGQPAPTE